MNKILSRHLSLHNIVLLHRLTINRCLKIIEFNDCKGRLLPAKVLISILRDDISIDFIGYPLPSRKRDVSEIICNILRHNSSIDNDDILLYDYLMCNGRGLISIDGVITSVKDGYGDVIKKIEPRWNASSTYIGNIILDGEVTELISYYVIINSIVLCVDVRSTGYTIEDREDILITDQGEMYPRSSNGETATPCNEAIELMDTLKLWIEDGNTF